MPLAFTSASSRFIVSLGPKLLLIVISPSAAMACAPNRHIDAINANFLRKTVIVCCPRTLVGGQAKFGLSHWYQFRGAMEQDLTLREALAANRLDDFARQQVM